MTHHFNPAATVAFTGHRNLIGNQANLFDTTFKIICDLHAKGYTTFLSGMAEGFDLLAAEAVLQAKTIYSDIRLVAVVPFPMQAERFHPVNQRRYRTVLQQADQQITISQHYYRDVFLVRNDFLLDNASYIVCHYSGDRGGTMYTVNRAVRRNLSITNTCAIGPTYLVL